MPPIQPYTIRPAQPADTGTLLGLIRQLAQYEKRPAAATATQEELQRWLFRHSVAGALLAENRGQALGYALYYPVFHSFAGQPSLYLEDLFVLPAHRSCGLGRALMQRLARQATQQGYAGLEWSCLAWNTPAMDFYRRLGAVQKPDAAAFALLGPALADLAGTPASL